MTRARFGPKFRRQLLIMIGCAVVLFWVLAPIYWIVVSSISTRTELYARPYKVWFPSQPTFEHYVALFTSGAQYRSGGFSPTAGLMAQGMRNSLVISISAALLVTVFSTGAGYVFARLNFRGKQLTFYFLMLLMPLPLWVALIALFFLMTHLQLLDTLPALTIIFIVFLAPPSISLISTFIRHIPNQIQH